MFAKILFANSIFVSLFKNKRTEAHTLKNVNTVVFKGFVLIRGLQFFI